MGTVSIDANVLSLWRSVYSVRKLAGITVSNDVTRRLDFNKEDGKISDRRVLIEINGNVGARVFKSKFVPGGALTKGAILHNLHRPS